MIVKPPDRPHDDLACGISPETDCPKCRPYTIRRIRLERIQERFEKSGIDFTDFADLLWLHFEDGMRRTIERMAREEVAKVLSGVQLHSVVDSRSLAVWKDINWE